MEFYDRTNERNILNTFLNQPDFGMYILYGRRRIGKTWLLKYCTAERRGIFFTGRQLTSDYLLNSFSKSISEFMAISGIHFENWEEAFDFVYSNSDRIHYLILDEFQYLVGAAPEIPSILQALTDHKKTTLKLFLCGSSISFMHGLLSYENPLFGRKTHYTKLMPIKFQDIDAFFQKSNSAGYHNMMTYYAIFDGIPQYLKMIDPNKRILENIEHLFLNIDSPLKEEPLFLLTEELREPRVYHSILEAISFGYNTSGEIASKTGHNDSRKIQPYLKTLEALELIKKEVPVTEKNPLRTRKGIYKIKDNLFAFWFRFIYPNMHFIENDMLQKVLNDIQLNLNQYCSFIFKEEARKFVQKHFGFDKTGNYWNKTIEIDILASKGEKWYAGECKWTSKKIGIAEYGKLLKKTESIKLAIDKYIFISKSGFEENIKALENVILIEFSDKYDWQIIKGEIV